MYWAAKRQELEQKLRSRSAAAEKVLEEERFYFTRLTHPWDDIWHGQVTNEAALLAQVVALLQLHLGIESERISHAPQLRTKECFSKGILEATHE